MSKNDFNDDSNSEKTKEILKEIPGKVVETLYETEYSNDHEEKVQPKNETVNILLVLLSKGILTKAAKQEVFVVIDGELGVEPGEWDFDENKKDVKKGDIEKVLRNPHLLFDDNNDHLLLSFLKYKNGYQMSQHIRQAIQKIDECLKLFMLARFVPVDEDLMQELLSEGKIIHIEGIGRALGNPQGASLKDIVVQRKKAQKSENDKPNSLTAKLSDARFRLIASEVEQDGSIELERLVHQFTELATRVGQRSYDLKYKYLNGEYTANDPTVTNVLLTRMAVISVLSGREPIDPIKKIEYQASTETYSPEAKRQFEIGKKCLENAKSEEELIEAKEAFYRSVATDPTNAAAHFAVGTLERLLKNYQSAEMAFKKAISFSDEARKDVYSLANQGLSEIAYRITGKLPQALHFINEAIKKDESNGNARFDRAKYLATLGFTDEALAELVSLVLKDENYLLQMKIEPAFQSIPRPKLKHFADSLIKRGIKDEHAKVIAFEMAID